MIEIGTKVKVNRRYGTTCDGMEGTVVATPDFFTATVKFSEGDEVVLPIDSLEEI